jgi:hypothetical protein
MTEVIGPVEIGIFVFITFVLPVIIISTDDWAWERSKRGEKTS